MELERGSLLLPVVIGARKLREQSESDRPSVTILCREILPNRLKNPKLSHHNCLQIYRRQRRLDCPPLKAQKSLLVAPLVSSLVKHFSDPDTWTFLSAVGARCCVLPDDTDSHFYISVWSVASGKALCAVAAFRVSQSFSKQESNTVSADDSE